MDKTEAQVIYDTMCGVFHRGNPMCFGIVTKGSISFEQRKILYIDVTFEGDF